MRSAISHLTPTHSSRSHLSRGLALALLGGAALLSGCGPAPTPVTRTTTTTEETTTTPPILQPMVPQPVLPSTTTTQTQQFQQ